MQTPEDPTKRALDEQSGTGEQPFPTMPVVLAVIGLLLLVALLFLA